MHSVLLISYTLTGTCYCFHFCLDLHFLPSNSTSTFIWIMYYECLWDTFIDWFMRFIYSFDNIKILLNLHLLFYWAYIFYKMESSAVLQLTSPCWCDHAWLTSWVNIFMANDTPNPSSTSSKTKNVWLMNPGNYTISCFFLKYLWMSTISLTSIVS